MHMGISKEHDELCLESTSTASNALHCLVTMNKLEFATAKLDHTMHEYVQTASSKYGSYVKFQSDQPNDKVVP